MYGTVPPPIIKNYLAPDIRSAGVEKLFCVCVLKSKSLGAFLLLDVVTALGIAVTKGFDLFHFICHLGTLVCL